VTEWLNLIVGLWLIASPWVLHFSGTRAMRSDVIVGIIAVLLAGIEIIAAPAAPAPMVRKR
jgi:hypothetical protein